MGPEHAAVASTLYGLSHILHAAGQLDDAESVLRDGIAMRTRLHGPGHHLVGAGYGQLGRLLTTRGAYREAETHLLRGLAILQQEVSGDHAEVRQVRALLAELYDAMGRPNDAARYRDATAG